MADTDERPDVAEHPVRARYPLAPARRGGGAVLVVLATLILVVLGLAYWDDLGRSEDGGSAPQTAPGHGDSRLAASCASTSDFSVISAAQWPSG